MMLQNEYFILESINESCLFSWDQEKGQFGLGKPVVFEKPIKVRVCDPIPRNPKFMDFHEMPEPVFSKRVYDVLVPMDIYGIQLAPAKVYNPKAEPFEEPRDYWFMHVWNRIHCLDLNNSELEYSGSGNRIFSIEKLVIDEKKLGQFELYKRQVFELAEKTSVLLIHQSVKDVIMSVNPEGCRFFEAAKWNSNSSFT